MIKNRTIYWRDEVSAAHQLNLPYESKCQNVHGHNYDVEVWIELKSWLNKNGMIADFSKIKKIVMEYDHSMLNEIMDKNPTAENLSEEIATKLRRQIFGTIDSVIEAEITVRIWEDENSYAETVVVTIDED